ncbi:MAG: transglutaminase domain-containing protein [Planctomycetes bacterium]|nr:transglutaminase domain-containing protein [Planctomycetota bacterium]
MRAFRGTAVCVVALATAMAMRPGPGGAEEASTLSRERTVFQYMSPGRYRPLRFTSFPGDPVPPLGHGDVDLIAGGLKPSELEDLLAGYATRMANTYARLMPADLAVFLAAHKEVREVFLPALDPRYDDLGAAFIIFNELRKPDETTLLKYVHLATAISVVHDTPDALSGSRYCCINGIAAGQFPESIRYTAVWNYYTSPGIRFTFNIDRLPWPILVHLVDLDLSADELKWATARYRPGTDIASLYKSVPYDTGKLNTMGPGRLAGKPYTLENILAWGGICGDQAHYTTRVAKALGVPAMKVAGQSRFGGVGHAWAGFLAVKGDRPALDFTGRYFADYFYTGDVFDPQTRTVTLDRYVAMMYDGASLSYARYHQSQVLARMAEALKDSHPGESLLLVQDALRLNYYNMWGWALLMEHIRSGTMEKQEGARWFGEMLLVLKEHPDITFECLQTFTGCLPITDQKGRQAIYNQVFGLYGKRPDLQLKLRMVQADELARTGRTTLAVDVLAATVVQNAEEGALVLPAMRMAVETANLSGLQERAFNTLRKADADFPKTRFDKPSEAYMEYLRLLATLRPAGNR